MNSSLLIIGPARRAERGRAGHADQPRTQVESTWVQIPNYTFLDGGLLARSGASERKSSTGTANRELHTIHFQMVRPTALRGETLHGATDIRELDALSHSARRTIADSSRR